MESTSEQNISDSNSGTTSSFGASTLFFTTVIIIFMAEAIVMMIIYLLDIPPHFFIGIIDASLLSLIVAPALYFTFFKPMQESFLKREQSEAAQKRLEAIDEMKNNFISVVSHELRTPVTAIIGYSEIIQNDVQPEQQKEFTELIRKKGEALDRIIDDLETVSRPEFAKGFELDQDENDLLESVKQVCAFYIKQHPDVSIDLDVKESSIMMVYDEVRICQALENLLSNAIKYSKGSDKKVNVSLSNRKDYVTIHVKDNGIGMTRNEVDNIFDVFYRAEAKKDVVSGLGLGMSIVKNIIDSHSGTIKVTSQKGIGTRVTVKLPKRCTDNSYRHQLETCPIEEPDMLQSRTISMEFL